ncbi:MAG: translation elongation factor Ts [Proteobacteria bacterium]|nr:translation elongation factor Ts [Pseudomonadota bacterium]NIS69538.1 translation elongation factor Ts [Pseudomonadota bacterium]
MIDGNLVKELRQRTGAGIMDCKRALEETAGNLEKAIDHLRKKGLAKAAKKSGRVTKEGLVGSYIHAGGKIGVLVELNCETDFVTKTDEFQGLLKDTAMQIAASNPLYLDRGKVPEEVIEKERQILRTQAIDSGKPEKVIDRIVEGRLEKFFSEVCLLDQPFIKDPDMTVQEVLNTVISKIGENIAIRRFTRYQVGEALDSE